MSQTIVYGNIYTLDERRPFARAALVRDGTFAYIGDPERVRSLADDNASVLDYGDDYVYPGFLEAHTHGHYAGDRAIGQADLTKAGLTTDYPRYREIIREFIEQNPQREVYLAAGWVENDEYVSKAYLDEICADRPLIMNTGGGHSMLLNTRALEWAGIDAAYAKRVGYDMVHVDEAGEPDGYIAELPVLEVMHKIPTSFEDAKRYLLAWQDICFSHGFTAVADAGVENFYQDSGAAYVELEREGKLKLRTYAYLVVPDNPEDPRAEIERIAAERARHSSEHYHIVGAKAFLDGVIEAHTGWQIDEYADQPGYHGVRRFCDHDKMVELICAADAEGLSVHVHSVGDGATHFMLDCIEDAERVTGDLDQRNVMAHLQFVTDEDVRRMGETHTIAAVAPLWTPKTPGVYDNEVKYVGRELAEKAYPIKSFCDAGADVVFHSDYPISPLMDVKLSVCLAEKRSLPASMMPGVNTLRWPEESIGRMESLRAMAINVACAWHQESRMGTIEVGKLANMTVFDSDFLHDEAKRVAQANLVATIVDGEEVYRA